MERNWTKWVTTLGGMASIVVLAVTICDPAALHEGTAPESAGEAHQFNPWIHEGDEDEPAPMPAREKPAGEDRWVRFVDGEERGVDAKVLLGAAGMWPFKTTQTESGGFVTLPPMEAKRFDGGGLELYELLVRSREDDEGESLGFWGLVHGPGQKVAAADAHQVRMEEAAPLEFKVVNEEGEPIEEAYVRVSRDSVGLVHLHETTKEDGLVTFRAIPAGSYYLTLDADGYRRTTLTLEHSEELSSALHVTLEDGAGVRTPQSWRRPSLQEALARSEAEVADTSGGGSSDGDSGAASGEAAGATGGAPEADGGASEEVAESTATIAVRVDNDRGSAVEDAWIEAWVGGARVAEGRSRGWTPETLDVPEGASVDIVATHSGWGEGVARIGGAADGDDAVVRLDDMVPSQTPARDRIVWLADIEDVLDAEVVETRRGLKLDPEYEGAGAQAGVQRGDTLYFVRRQGSGYVALVERGGEFVEIAVP